MKLAMRTALLLVVMGLIAGCGETALDDAVPRESGDVTIADTELFDEAEVPVLSSSVMQSSDVVALGSRRHSGRDVSFLTSSAHATPTGTATTPRKLIRNASMTIRVDSVELALAVVGKLAVQLGGYVTNQDLREGNSTRRGTSRSGSITLRISADQIDEALDTIRQMGDVRRERIWSQDVTERYFDLGVRLKNARNAREPIVRILKRAKSVRDVLQAQKALQQVTTEIDRYTGRLKRLENQIRFATLQVRFQQIPPPLEDRETVLGKLSNAVSNMVDTFWRTIAGIIIFIGWLIPVSVVVVPLIWGVSRLVRRWRRRRDES
jgi:hypothetical protein